MLAPATPRDEVRAHRLANGLELVLVPRPGLHAASIALFVRVGSRFETARDNGLSHFLEHMLFRGTKTLASAHDQALAFEQLGATLGGETHVDHGALTANVPPENLCEVLSLLGEVVASPRFSAIDVERSIVREELLEDLDDDGRCIDADTLVRELVYGGAALGQPVIGSLETLGGFDEAGLRKHHQRHYVGSNMVLCVAGNLDPDATFAHAERCFGSLPKGERAAVEPPSKRQQKPRLKFVRNNSSQSDLRLAFRAPSENDPDEPAAEMLLRILDDGMSTRLYERICDRKGLCYDVSAFLETYEDDGLVDLAAGVHHERVADVAEEMVALCIELRDTGPTTDELDRAKRRHSWSTRAMLDDADALAQFHGLASLASIRRTLSERHEELSQVTARQVRDVAGAIFDPKATSAIVVGLLTKRERQRVERAISQL